MAVDDEANRRSGADVEPALCSYDYSRRPSDLSVHTQGPVRRFAIVAVVLQACPPVGRLRPAFGSLRRELAALLLPFRLAERPSVHRDEPRVRAQDDRDRLRLGAVLVARPLAIRVARRGSPIRAV